MQAFPLVQTRADFAHQVMNHAGVVDEALVAAFAKVEREAFLARGPWRIAYPGGYSLTDSDDPREVYVDALIALDAARRINNGLPSAHALWIHALGLQRGERVDHIGAGAGYYSAILAELVGAYGRLEAFEIDPDLARRAREALADRGNVKVHAESGVDRALPAADAIYVNAGASAPNAAWLEALSPSGRLLFPLTGEDGYGGMLKITRTDGERWPAKFISGAAFINLIGGRDQREAAAVSAAFGHGGALRVRWYIRDNTASEDDWLRVNGWRLTL